MTKATNQATKLLLLMEIKIVIKFCLGDSDCEGVVFIGEKHALISLQLKTGGILGYNYYDSP